MGGRGELLPPLPALVRRAGLPLVSAPFWLRHWEGIAAWLLVGIMAGLMTIALWLLLSEP